MTAREGNVLHTPGTSSVAKVGGEEILASYVRLIQVGGTIAPDQGVVEAGTVLSWDDENSLYEAYVGAVAATKETQGLTFGGAGLTSFTLTFSGQTTGAIAASAANSVVKAAIEALSNVTTVNVTGTPGTLQNVEFVVPLGNVAQMTSTPTGGTGSVTVSTVTAGTDAVAAPLPAVGVLRKSVDTDDGGHLINVVLGGSVKVGSLIGFDANVASDLHGRVDAVQNAFVF